MSQPSSTPITPIPQSSNGTSPNPTPSPAGSPPLILAFLAIGIFSAAMIAVFGWRRVQFSRDPGLWGYREGIGSETRRGMRAFDSTASINGGTEKDLGEIPVMWEACADRSNKVEAVDYGCWESTMPLAVLPVHRGNSMPADRNLSSSASGPSLTSPSEPPLIFQSQQTSLRSSRRRQRFENATPLFNFRRHNHANTSLDIPLMGQRQENEGGGVEETEGKVQVAVIIEMPSPSSSTHRHRRSHYMCLTKSGVDNAGRAWEEPDDGNFQYCFGVHTCQWPISNTSLTTNGEQERISPSHTEKRPT